MNEVLQVDCPTCSSSVQIAFSIAALANTDKDELVVYLLFLARCKYCSERFGDGRSIRVFVEIEQDVIGQAIADGLPIVKVVEGE